MALTPPSLSGDLIYLRPTLFATLNVAVVEVFALEPLFATKTISIEAGPCVAGFHEQVATKGEDPDVDLFLHPEIIVPPALNVTFDATLTSAEIVVADR